MTTIDELEWFVVLAESEHMTRAAERLSITQPTLSRALGRLERQMGSPLFDRVNRGLRLNRFGGILLEHARRSLAELSSAEERIGALRDPARGTVRLAFLHSIAVRLTAELLRDYRGEAPEVTFGLTQAAGHEIVEHLRGGRVDLGLTGPRPQDPDLSWRGLYRERLCLAVPADHCLAGRSEVALGEVADEAFVTLQGPFGFRRLTDDLWSRAGVEPRIAFESTEIGTMEGLVAAGLGLAVVPSPRIGRAELGVTYVPLTDSAAHRPIGMVWLREQPRPPVVERFAAFVAGRFPGKDLPEGA